MIWRDEKIDVKHVVQVFKKVSIKKLFIIPNQIYNFKIIINFHQKKKVFNCRRWKVGNFFFPFIYWFLRWTDPSLGNSKVTLYEHLQVKMSPAKAVSFYIFWWCGFGARVGNFLTWELTARSSIDPRSTHGAHIPRLTKISSNKRSFTTARDSMRTAQDIGGVLLLLLLFFSLSLM